VAETVAEHKAMFFRMKAADDSVIDYGRAVKGGLVLIPRGEDLDALRADYNFMIEEGLLLEDAHDFDDLITQCTALQKEVTKPFRSEPARLPPKEIKERERTAQVCAALAVNRELILLYWSIGRTFWTGNRPKAGDNDH
jgi:hypothetical protein